MWIESINLYNVKNHKDAFIELTPGFNVICGESSTGKSNIITTIEWIYAETVATASHMIGPFDDFCSAKIIQRDRNGEKYVIEKYSELNGRKNVFFFNGQIYYANNNKIPDIVKQHNPIKVVNVNGNNYSPQMRRQVDPYFMLDSNQVDRISLCFWGTDVLILESMKKDTQKDVDKTEKVIKEKQERLDEVTNKIESMNYIGDWRNRLTTIRLKRDRYNTVDTQLKQIGSLEKELSQIRIMKSQYDLLPSLATVDKLIEYYTIYYSFIQYEQQLFEIAIIKQQFISLPDLATLDQLISLYNQLIAIDNLIKRADEVSAGLIKYTVKTDIANIDCIIERLNKITQVIALVTELEQVTTSKLVENNKINRYPLVSIDKSITNLKNLDLLSQFVAELVSTETLRSQLDSQVNEINKEINAIQQSLNSVTACPLCNQLVERWV